MKATELIERMQELVKKYGDLPVDYYDEEINIRVYHVIAVVDGACTPTCQPKSFLIL